MFRLGSSLRVTSRPPSAVLGSGAKAQSICGALNQQYPSCLAALLSCIRQTSVQVFTLRAALSSCTWRSTDPESCWCCRARPHFLLPTRSDATGSETFAPNNSRVRVCGCFKTRSNPRFGSKPSDWTGTTPPAGGFPPKPGPEWIGGSEAGQVLSCLCSRCLVSCSLVNFWFY